MSNPLITWNLLLVTKRNIARIGMRRKIVKIGTKRKTARIVTGHLLVMMSRPMGDGL
jgi:hypothetical protein